jgi:6-phosphogluconolactonase
MDVERLADPEAVAQRAAAFVAEAVAGGARDGTLAGGSSPMRSYELLGPLVADWAGVHLWYGDERCVAFDDPDSNHGQARARLDAPGAAWHPMPGPMGPDAGARAYAQELGDTQLDVTMLGMGPDGHTASLFPHHTLLDGQLDDWTGVHLWYGDERCVPFDDPDSNHGQVRARLRAPGAVWHPMPGPSGPQAGAAGYERELADVVFDLTHLGMGPDGHTASLFPDHPVLDAPGRAAGVSDSPKPPPERITLTLAALNGSRRIVLLVTGAEKADALARALGEPDRGTPASLLEARRLTVLADEAATAR